MARRRKTGEPGDWLFPNLTAAADDEDQSSLLDVVDNVLNKGAVLNGEVVLGLANVDLIYVKLSVLLAALDKVTKNDPVFRPVVAAPVKKRARSRGRRKR